MWDEQKQRQFDELRQQAEVRSMTSDEQGQYDQLIHELERDEWKRLRPSLDASLQEQEWLRTEIGHVRTQNAILTALGERYTDLLARAQVQLSSLSDEREELRAEYDRVMQ